MASLKIQFKPKYILTYIPEGKKVKKTHYPNVVKEPLTPMEILIEAKKNGWTPTNLRVDPECPAVIVLSSEGN